MLYTKFDHSSIFERDILDYLALNTDSSKAFVYIVNFTHYKKNLRLLWECLSCEERDQAKKYYTTDLSDRYIMSHGILRYLLSYYTGQLPQDIEFFHQEYGKPFLKNNNIQFNTSHSHDLVSYIISPHYRVGIDVEWHDMTLDIGTLADLVFTPNEQRLVTKFKTMEKLKFFYNLWTTKESLIKASGQGLSYPINSIETMILSPGQKICFDNKDSKFTQEWYYFPLEVVKGYSGAIAIEHRINEIVYLEMNNQSNVFSQIRSRCFN